MNKHIHAQILQPLRQEQQIPVANILHFLVLHPRANGRFDGDGNDVDEAGGFEERFGALGDEEGATHFFAGGDEDVTPVAGGKVSGNVI